MGILPFFTFFRSSVYIIIALCVVWLLFQNSVSSHAHQFSVFFLFCFFELYGGIIGSVVGENQHRMLTWTLPHFRKRLIVWSIIVGLFSVVVWTAALTFAPLNASWSTILLVNLGFYCIGFAFSGGWSLNTNRPGLIYKYRILIMLPVLALTYSWQEVLAFGEQHKLGLALIAFAIAIGTHYFAFNQTTFRSKPLSFFFWSLYSGFDPQTQKIWQKKKMMMRKASTGVWHLNHIGTGIYNWLRAGQYENSGLDGWRWPLSAFGAALAMVFFFLGMTTKFFGLLNQSPYDFETRLKTIYHMIFYFDQLDIMIVIQISLSVFIGICIFIPYTSFSLKRGYVYPLSRTRRMWIQYSGLLVQNISFIAASIIVLGVLGILSGAKVGFVSKGNISLGILRVFGWVVVLIPVCQWLQVKYDLYGFHLYGFQRTRRQIWGVAFLILVMILAIVIAGFTSLMRVWYPDLTLTYEVPILFVCFILLQWFLLARLKRYYATQDLI